MAQLVKNPPAMRETWIWFLSWEDPLEKGTATCLENPMDREAWRLQYMGSQSWTWLSNFHITCRKMFLAKTICIVFPRTLPRRTPCSYLMCGWYLNFWLYYPAHLLLLMCGGWNPYTFLPSLTCECARTPTSISHLITTCVSTVLGTGGKLCQRSYILLGKTLCNPCKMWWV